MSLVKKLFIRSVAILIAAIALVESSLAGPNARQTSERKDQLEERLVFVTGSMIPKRVKLRRIGTTTVSPVRIIDRAEIDVSGRQTTPGALINDPSVRIVGH
jgi:hypothetical protein